MDRDPISDVHRGTRMVGFVRRIPTALREDRRRPASEEQIRTTGATRASCEMIGPRLGDLVLAVPSDSRSIQEGIREHAHKPVRRAPRVRLQRLDRDSGITDRTAFLWSGPDGPTAESKGPDCHRGTAPRRLRRTRGDAGLVAGRGVSECGSDPLSDRTVLGGVSERVQAAAGRTEPEPARAPVQPDCLLC